MKERRFLVFRPNHSPDLKTQLTKEEKGHLKSLRLLPSQIRLEIRDGIGNSFCYLPEGLDNQFALEKEETLSKEKQSRVALAYPKGTRMDFFFEKATELGATEIFLLEWDRSIRKEFNMERAYRIFAQASSQSNRATLPQLFIFSIQEFLNQFGDRTLLLDPKSDRLFAKAFEPGMIPLVGPEGGFSEKEREGGLSGLQHANLGEGILRLETASLAVLAWQRLSG